MTHRLITAAPTRWHLRWSIRIEAASRSLHRSDYARVFAVTFSAVFHRRPQRVCTYKCATYAHLQRAVEI